MSELSDYEVLKQAGHSTAKAAEIALDAKRGDKTAQKWVEIARGNGFKPEQPMHVIALTEAQFELIKTLVEFHLECDDELDDPPYDIEALKSLHKTHFCAD